MQGRSLWRHLAVCAGALLVAGPASADVTIQVNVAWHDFAATAAAVDVTTSNANTGFFDRRSCTLTMNGPYAGTCTVVFPDGDADPNTGGGGTFFASTISLIAPCDNSAFNFAASGAYNPSCGTGAGGDQTMAPTGAWFEFIEGSDIVTAQAGQSVEYNLALTPSRGVGNVAGKISPPPGATIAGGTVSTSSNGFDSDGPYFIQAFGALTGPNPDGSFNYSVPAVAGSFASLGFNVRLASGTEFFYHTGTAAPAASGLTAGFDVAASNFTYVSGNLSWNTLHAKSAQVQGFSSIYSQGAVHIAPDGLSGTYDLVVAPDSSVFSAAAISTCASTTSCDQGTIASFYSLGSFDTTGAAGQAIGHDIALAAAFTTLSGTITVNGVVTKGGTGVVAAYDPVNGQFTQTGFSFGANGAINLLVGQGQGSQLQFVVPAKKCQTTPSAFFSVDLGAAPVQQSFVLNVNAALPGAAVLTLGLDALAKATNATYQLQAQWQGTFDGTYFCNAGSTSDFQVFTGPQAAVPLANLMPGPWSFRYVGNGVTQAGPLSQALDFVSPPLLATVPAAGTVTVKFAARQPDFAGGLETGTWQLGPSDTANLSSQAESSNGDGSFFYANSTSAGRPAHDHLPVDLVVAANEPLAPLSLQASANYALSSTGSSGWSLTGTAAVGPIASGTQSMPGLDQLRVRGVGSWTVNNLPVPAGAQFVNAGLNYQAGNVSLYGSSVGASLPMKLLAGSYGTGAQITVAGSDSSGNFFENSYPIGGEIAPGDALADTVSSPILLNRSPNPGTYCATPCENDPDGGGTRIDVAFNVATSVKLLKSVSVGGQAARPDASGNVKASVLLPLGTWPSTIVATQNSGDQTSWDRTYTVPVSMQALDPLGALVPDGSAHVPIPSVAVKLGSTVKLQLAVTSCGREVSNAKAYAVKPRLVDVSRSGQDLSLATIDPGGEDADGDIDFQLGGDGVWKLKLKTSLLGTGTFVMRFEAPDATLWEAILVVKR